MNQLIKLENYGAIAVSGQEQKLYLQGQLTCDLNQIEEQKYLLGCLCSAQGKLISTFYLIKLEQIIYLIMRKGILQESLLALKKYAMFSKVDIVDASDDIYFYGTVGNPKIANSIAEIEIESQIRLHLFEQPQEQTKQLDQAQWELALIKAIRPELETPKMQNEYVPQFLNQVDLGAVSFKKGCYIGQETVARTRYLGKQKRATFYLCGCAENIQAGDEIEQEFGNNWRYVGQVINAVYAENKWHLLAILPIDIEIEQNFRAANQHKSKLELKSQIITGE